MALCPEDNQAGEAEREAEEVKKDYGVPSGVSQIEQAVMDVAGVSTKQWHTAKTPSKDR